MITRSVTPERIALTHTPPGIVRLLGGGALALDVGLALAGASLVRAGEQAGFVLLALGVVGVLFAAPMLFGRRTQVVTREAITETWWLLVPVRTRVVRVADVTALVLLRTFRRVKHSVVVIDQLFALDAHRRYSLVESGDPGFAGDAEAITKLLGKPLRDERARTAAKMIPDTQASSAPVAIAIGLVVVCLLFALGLTAVLARRGPSQNSSAIERTPVTPSRDHGDHA